jgi:hypothetical protein
MSDMIKNAKAMMWEWRVAAFWFFLFSVNTLFTSITAALVGTDWATLDAQSKFMIFIAVAGNWTGTIMAFISKQAGRIQKTGLPFPAPDETSFITRTQTQTDSLKISPPPAAPAAETNKTNP